MLFFMSSAFIIANYNGFTYPPNNTSYTRKKCLLNSLELLLFVYTITLVIKHYFQHILVLYCVY